MEETIDAKINWSTEYVSHINANPNLSVPYKSTMN
jgi:hypothetical protein